MDAAEWRIPAEKMKARQPHRVPLSRQAVAILRELHPLTGRGQWVFPGARAKDEPLSENTLNAALRRMRHDKTMLTAHGFRSIASTMLLEQGWPSYVIERQQAHAERNKVKSAYDRSHAQPGRAGSSHALPCQAASRRRYQPTIKRPASISSSAPGLDSHSL